MRQTSQVSYSILMLTNSVKNPNSTWLVTSRHVMSRHVKCVETSMLSRAVRQAWHSQSTWSRYVKGVESCWDV